MKTIYNNVEGKVIFQGNDREFIDFTIKVANENDDLDGNMANFSIEGVNDCVHYIETYCDNLDFLKLARYRESLNIYFDNGEFKDPTYIAYWHLDEVVEDAISMLNAVKMFYTDVNGLLEY